MIQTVYTLTLITSAIVGAACTIRPHIPTTPKRIVATATIALLAVVMAIFAPTYPLIAKICIILSIALSASWMRVQGHKLELDMKLLLGLGFMALFVDASTVSAVALMYFITPAVVMWGTASIVLGIRWYGVDRFLRL